MGHDCAQPFADHQTKGSSGSSRFADIFGPRRVARLYLYSFGLALLVGALLPLLARIIGAWGERYGVPSSLGTRLLHLHSAIMVYLCVIPGIPAALGGFLLPQLLGQEHCSARRVAWSSLSLYWFGAVIIIISILIGGIETDNSNFPFYSSKATPQRAAMAIGLFMVGLAAALNGLQAIRSVRSFSAARVRQPNVPTLAYLLCIAGAVHLVAIPLQGLTVTMMLLERLGTHTFLDFLSGGDATLLRQFAWAYLQPVMLAAIIPAIGLVSHVLDQHSTWCYSDHALAVHSAVALAILGFFTWGIHLVSAGQSPLSCAIFSAMNILLIVPLSLPFAVWLRRLSSVHRPKRAGLVPVLCVIAMLAAGLITGLPLSLLGVNGALHGTRIFMSHIHLLGCAICVLATLVGLQYAWPELTPGGFPKARVLRLTLLIFLGLSMMFGVQLFAGVRTAQKEFTLGYWARMGDAGLLIAVGGLLMTAIHFTGATIKARNSRPPGP